MSRSKLLVITTCVYLAITSSIAVADNTRQYSTDLLKLVAISTQGGSLSDAPRAWQETLVIDVAEIKEFVTSNQNVMSFHALFLIQQRWPLVYKEIANEVKARILVSAMTKLNDLSDFGYMQPQKAYDGPLGKRWELGADAIPFLLEALEDNSEAPLSGGEMATLYERYRYRRSDFAYRYTTLANGESPVFYSDVNLREKQIDKLRRELKERKR